MSTDNIPEYNMMARVSLGLGLLGVVTAFIPPFLSFSIFCAPLGVLGTILGVIALRQIRAGYGRPADRWVALFGMILGVLPMLVLCGIFVYYLSTGQIQNLTYP